MQGREAAGTAWASGRWDCPHRPPPSTKAPSGARRWPDGLRPHEWVFRACFPISPTPQLTILPAWRTCRQGDPAAGPVQGPESRCLERIGRPLHCRQGVARCRAAVRTQTPAGDPEGSARRIPVADELQAGAVIDGPGRDALRNRAPGVTGTPGARSARTRPANSAGRQYRSSPAIHRGCRRNRCH